MCSDDPNPKDAQFIHKVPTRRELCFCNVHGQSLRDGHDLVLGLRNAKGTRPGVHQAVCLKPRNNPSAPVGVIYLHGWFPTSGSSGYYVDLEKRNRRQLQELADKTGVSIAVPLAQWTHPKNGMRTWSPSQSEGSAQTRLKQIEAKSRAACGGSPLAKGRTLVGFSDGGFMAREIGLQCAASSAEYSAIIMSGAAPRSAPSRLSSKCAKLVTIRGSDDDSTSPCIRRSNGKCVAREPYSQASQRMKSGAGRVELAKSYNGGHILPPNSWLSSQVQAPDSAVADTQLPPALTPSLTPSLTPPANRPSVDPYTPPKRFSPPTGFILLR
ncbi:MAG: hypothetical protein AB7F86_10445 [Bdellovibrionales bacterium]